MKRGKATGKEADGYNRVDDELQRGCEQGSKDYNYDTLCKSNQLLLGDRLPSH